MGSLAVLAVDPSIGWMYLGISLVSAGIGLVLPVIAFLAAADIATQSRCHHGQPGSSWRAGADPWLGRRRLAVRCRRAAEFRVARSSAAGGVDPGAAAPFMVDACGPCAACFTCTTRTQPELTCARLQLKEQHMDWLAQNWIWVLFGIAFVEMHLFGHGGRGGHGGHGSHGDHGPVPASRRDAGDAKSSRTAGIRPAVPPAGST